MLHVFHHGRSIFSFESQIMDPFVHNLNARRFFAYFLLYFLIEVVCLFEKDPVLA